MMKAENSQVAGPPSRTVLVVAPWLQGGGAQKALQGLLTRVPREHVRLVVIFKGNRHHEKVLDLAGESVELNLPRTPVGILRALRALRPLVRQAHSVYSLMRGSHLVLGFFPASAWRETRLAATFHQYPSQDSDGLRGRAEDLLVRRTVRYAHLVTAPSARAVEELRRAPYSTPAVYEANLLDLAVGGSHVLPRTEVQGPLRLLFVGRLTEQKGLDRIPELLAVQDVPVHLEVVGDGELLEEIQRMAASSHSPHTIALLGHRNDVVARIDAADAIFLPSRWELNPVVVWEAWSRGRPVIASDIDAFRDLKSLGPVMTFTYGEELAHILRELVRDSGLRLELYKRGIAAVQTEQESSKIVEFLFPAAAEGNHSARL
jgi:glycosyltransferase involved in cell wall biosynthesis